MLPLAAIHPALVVSRDDDDDVIVPTSLTIKMRHLTESVLPWRDGCQVLPFRPICTLSGQGLVEQEHCGSVASRSSLGLLAFPKNFIFLEIFT